MLAPEQDLGNVTHADLIFALDTHHSHDGATHSDLYG